MYTHLSYDMIGAHLAGVKDHPQKFMKDLSIEYEAAVPQSIVDNWKFFNVTNLPENLPSYLEVVDYEPLDFIGFGLSEDDARKLSKLTTIEADNFILNKQIKRELEDERYRNQVEESLNGSVFSYDVEDVVLTLGGIEIKGWGLDTILSEGGNKMINWSKVRLDSTGCLALTEPPPLAEKHPSILYCEEVNYLLWKYGYLDKGYTLADVNEDFGYGHRVFIESLFCKYYNLSDNICEISMEVWNARVKN